MTRRKGEIDRAIPWGTSFRTLTPAQLKLSEHGMLRVAGPPVDSSFSLTWPGAPLPILSHRRVGGSFCALGATGLKMRAMLDLTTVQLTALLIALAAAIVFAVAWYVWRLDRCCSYLHRGR
jgi:hypothetical protein